MTSDRGSVMRVHAGIPLQACEVIIQHWPNVRTFDDERDRGRISSERQETCQRLCSPPDLNDL